MKLYERMMLWIALYMSAKSMQLDEVDKSLEDSVTREFEEKQAANHIVIERTKMYENSRCELKFELDRTQNQLKIFARGPAYNGGMFLDLVAYLIYLQEGKINLLNTQLLGRSFSEAEIEKVSILNEGIVDAQFHTYTIHSLPIACGIDVVIDITKAVH